jgi:Protein of unknown function (DUF3987)
VNNFATNGTTDNTPRTCNAAIGALPIALNPLCAKNQWVTWSWIKNGSGKWTKPPFQARVPHRLAKNNDSATWSSHAEAVQAVKQGAGKGIGFVLTGTEVAAIDLDHCRDPETGVIDAWAQVIVDRAPQAYVEVTVSGCGLRIIGTATGHKTHTKYGIDGRIGAGIELYRRAVRYVTVSGLQVGECNALPNIDGLIDDLAALYGGERSHLSEQGDLELANRGINDLIRNGVPQRLRSQAFQSVVWRLANTGLSIANIEQILAEHPDGIARKYGDRLREEIERSYGKWRTFGGANSASDRDDPAGHAEGHGRASASPRANSHDWHDPDLSIVDDRRGELPAFPLDVLSPSWQIWATNAALGAGVTVDHLIVPLLGIASSLIGTARRVGASRSWSEPFTMWTGIVGFSGTGKTPGLDVTKRALSEIERDRKTRIDKLRCEHESNAERARASYKNWKADVAEAVEKGMPAPPPDDATVPDQFVAPRLYISNSTVEKIGVLLQARPRGMLIICEELASLFLNLSRYSGGTDREFWLEAWNGKHYVVERLGRPAVVLDHLLVGMTGGFQPEKLARSFQGDADGLYARICFAWPLEPAYRALTDDTDEVEPEFENTLARLIDLPAEENGKLLVSRIGLSAESRATFEQFRLFAHQEKAGFDGREREWWAKSPAHILRLAGTLAYLEWAMRTAGQPFIAPEPNVIEACFMDAAVRLVRDYFWPHSRAALRQIGLSERHAKARAVLRWIRKNHKTEVSREDIRRDALSQSLDADQVQDLIDGLVKAGWLRQITIRTPGRSRNRWEVNPKLFANDTAGSAESAERG